MGQLSEEALVFCLGNMAPDCGGQIEAGLVKQHHRNERLMWKKKRTLKDMGQEST